MEALKETILDLENENCNLKVYNAKLNEEIQQMSSQLAVTQVDDGAVSDKNNVKIEKKLIGNESPERFEIIDKNMSVFKERDSVISLDDNISNNSFNTSEWINLNIPQDIQMDHVTKKIDFENRFVLHTFYTIDAIFNFQ